jgi:hypothetical protein
MSCEVVDLRTSERGCRANAVTLLVERVSEIVAEGRKGKAYEFVFSEDDVPEQLVVEYLERQGLRVIGVDRDDGVVRVRAIY